MEKLLLNHLKEQQGYHHPRDEWVHRQLQQELKQLTLHSLKNKLFFNIFISEGQNTHHSRKERVNTHTIHAKRGLTHTHHSRKERVNTHHSRKERVNTHTIHAKRGLTHTPFTKREG